MSDELRGFVRFPKFLWLAAPMVGIAILMEIDGEQSARPEQHLADRMERIESAVEQRNAKRRVRLNKIVEDICHTEPGCKVYELLLSNEEPALRWRKAYHSRVPWDKESAQSALDQSGEKLREPIVYECAEVEIKWRPHPRFAPTLECEFEQMPIYEWLAKQGQTNE